LARLSKAELGCDACVVGEHTDHSGSSAYAFCRGHLVHRQGAGVKECAGDPAVQKRDGFTSDKDDPMHASFHYWRAAISPSAVSQEKSQQ